MDKLWYEDENYKIIILDNIESTEIATIENAKLNIVKKSSVWYNHSIYHLGRADNSFVFKKLYHKGWSLYIKNNSSESINFLTFLYRKPIFDDTHCLVREYANGWTIDPEYIKQNFSKEYYNENPDGSIDIELVMYFKPQSYFYLGLLISGTTLLGCFGYLIYDWQRRKNIKLTKKNDKENS